MTASEKRASRPERYGFLPGDDVDWHSWQVGRAYGQSEARRGTALGAVLTWCSHMLDDHPALTYIGVCYLILSALAIAALASAAAA